ncbi:MAG: hypothetical protein J7647_00045 [Cyanobacteria bacterium SBLK]|nr:hypothetical protein [Cyanobacteria bacterium SBLK]
MRTHLSKTIIQIVILILLILTVFWPSFDHFHRHDQWDYLLDTFDKHRFNDIFSSTYSYNRTRLVAPGDIDLYRPVLFLLLGLQKSLFGVEHYAFWQGTSLLLHCLTACFLFLLLQRLLRLCYELDKNSVNKNHRQKTLRLLHFYPFFCSLFFAISPAIQELVIWTHLGGYILFTTLFVGFLYCLCSVFLIERERYYSLDLYIAWFLLLVMSFLYELGQIIAAIAGFTIFFFLRNCERKYSYRASFFSAIPFFAIPLIYQISNRIDLILHLGQYNPESREGFLIHATHPNTIHHTIRWINFTIIQPLIPSTLHGLFHGNRLEIQESISNLVPPSNWIEFLCSPIFIVGLGCWIFLTFNALRKVLITTDKPFWKTPSFYIVTIIFLTFSAYSSVILLGRLNARPGPHMLTTNSYYPYFAFLLFIIFSFLLWLIAYRQNTIKETKWIDINLSLVLIFTLLIGSIYNGFSTYNNNLTIQEALKESTTIVKQINSFINKHGSEDDFDLAFDNYRNESPVLESYRVPLTSMLYNQYEDVNDPKYVVVFEKNGKLDFYPQKDYREKFLVFDKQLFPNLVRPDSFHYYFYYQYRGWNIVLLRSSDRVYGIPQGEGPFSIERFEQGEYSRFLIEDSVKEIIKIIDDRIDESNSNVKLVSESYRGFKLIRFNNHFYGIPEEEGPLSLEKLQEGDYDDRILLEDSIGAILRRIDNRSDESNDIGMVKLALEGYKGFNIIQADGRFYAILQSEGAFSLERIQKKDYSLFFIGNSIEEVKKAIEERK